MPTLASKSCLGATLGPVHVARLRLPLRTPYKLAFGDVVAFDTMIARIWIGSRAGFGEATILSGYTPETIDQAWQAAGQLASTLAGLNVRDATQCLERASAAAPFTAAMFATAIDMASGHTILKNDQTVSVPLLFGLNSTDPNEIDRELDVAFDAGYRTVKVKVGFDVNSDMERVRHIQNSNNGRMSLRIDGNQGFDLAEASSFAGQLDPANIELLEQPCHMDDWPANSEVIKVSNVPVMLDESIYTVDDVDRAAEIGARFVKLKLMKMGSLDKLRDGLDRIRSLGMEPVLGNGVASDPGCWMEACVARDLITNAGEMNGFMRTSEPIVSNPLTVKAGAIQIPADYWPELDMQKLGEFTVATAEFDPALN